LSLIFIGCEVLGRAYLVATGVAPARGPDLVKIVIGGIRPLASWCTSAYALWRATELKAVIKS
jgi:hypothetical protein